jgi:hypothetical protein
MYKNRNKAKEVILQQIKIYQEILAILKWKINYSKI